MLIYSILLIHTKILDKLRFCSQRDKNRPHLRCSLFFYTNFSFLSSSCLCMRNISKLANFPINSAQIAQIQIMQILVTGDASVGFEFRQGYL